MRIGMDATCLPQAPAGVGRYLRGLLTALAGLDTSHEYVVFIKESDRAWFRALEHPRLTWVTIPHTIRPARLLWELVMTPRVIDQFRLDVWHAPHYIVPLSAGRCRVVVTFHDMTFHLFPEWYSTLKRMAFQWALPRAARTAHRIIADSYTTKEDITHLLHVEPDRITVIHPGLDPAFRPVEDAAVLAAVRARYRLDAPYILAVGTLDRRKNLLTLVRAYDALVEREQADCLLVLAGQRGNDAPALLQEIAARRLHDRVRLVGYVADEDLPALYTGARLFVSASRYEGFGFPVLEAMACGTPVLTSPSPSVMEMAGNDGVILDPLDAQEWCDRMAGALVRPASRLNDGSPFAAQYSWTEAARQTLRVYEEVFGHEGTSPASNGGAPLAAPPLDRLFDDEARPQPPSNGVVSDGLHRAILKTIVYSDLFDYPLSAAETHRGLIGHRAEPDEVTAALQSPALSEKIAELNGLYMLKGRETLGDARAVRAARAAQLLTRHRPLLRWLCACPFVRMVALSGGIAFENCGEESDIDLFVIVEGARIWSTYAFLAGVAKLIGKRDLLCLNYLIGRTDYCVEEHDFFTAHQIASLKPIYGWERFRRFTAANGWVTAHLPQWNGHANGTVNHRASEIVLSPWAARLKRGIEFLLGLPVFHPIDWSIYRLYRRRILRKVAGRTHSGVRLGRHLIKLHTTDHGGQLLERFERRVAEVEHG
ncbi:MAG: glycosyltransferase [Candidatus Latescibacteria bacterium]|nr:glycosyltransferase [Candidatus Latescibacterota bacterium]